MSWDILPKGNLQYFLQKLKGKIGTPTELTTAQYNALPTSDKNDASKVYYLTDYPSGGGSSGGGSGFVEMEQAEYESITPEANKVYFVYQGDTSFELATMSTNAAWSYANVGNETNELAVFVSLNSIVYAGFFFDINTRISTVMSGTELADFAEKLNFDYRDNSVTVLTQDQNAPRLEWTNGSNHDTLYLDATDITTVGVKCTYTGCRGYLYRDVIVNEIYLNGRKY